MTYEVSVEAADVATDEPAEHVHWRIVRDEGPQNQVEVSVHRRDGTVESVRFPDPYGRCLFDGELTFAADRSHLMLDLSTGQSASVTLVCRLVPRLEILAALPIAYLPKCDPDVRFVAGVAEGRGFAVDDPDLEWWEPPTTSGPAVFEVARVEVLDLATGTRATHPVLVEFPVEGLIDTARGPGALEQWMFEHLDSLDFALGAGGEAAVVTWAGRFTFTLPAPSPSAVLTGRWLPPGGEDASFPLTAGSSPLPAVDQDELGTELRSHRH